MLFKVCFLLVLLEVNIFISASDWKQNQIQLEDDIPTVTVANKEFVLGIFFVANWYRASQFCRFHDMHLASFNSAEEYFRVLDLINAFGLTGKRFWTSGNSLASSSDFFWMSNGQPLTYTSWFDGEPNNPVAERCIEIWNRNVTTNPLRWNNSPCSSEFNFVCERYL